MVGGLAGWIIRECTSFAFGIPSMVMRVVVPRGIPTGWGMSAGVMFVTVQTVRVAHAILDRTLACDLLAADGVVPRPSGSRVQIVNDLAPFAQSRNPSILSSHPVGFM
jgi:hypothetical protein